MSIPRLPAPHPALPVAGAAAILIASYPSTLPRSPVVAAVVTAVLCVVATVPAAFATRRRIRQDNDSSARVLLACGFTLVGPVELPDDGLVNRWELLATRHGTSPHP